MSDYVIAEYIWLDANKNLRSKTKTIFYNSNKIVLDKKPLNLEDYPIWNYDGSSTGQAVGNNSEVFLRPVKIYRDPFRASNNSVLVLCDTWNEELDVANFSNSRARANTVMSNQKVVDAKPWYGFELEFFLMSKSTHKPLGFPKDGKSPTQGQFYCSIGSQNAFGRDIIEKHYQYCLKSGIQVTGINAEVACGQWEYQIIGEGIEAADDVWMSRYILERICEQFGVYSNWEPKPIEGDCNGSGMHTNYSTLKMRSENGIDTIFKAIEKLEERHHEHIKVYGDGNEKRLTGKHETSSMEKFKWGFADREASIRVSNQVKKDKKGYLEDRRPGSSCDVYDVVAILAETTILL